jgi:hypothetical protein
LPTSDGFSLKRIILVNLATIAAALVGFWGTFDFLGGVYASVYLAVVAAWYIIIQVRFLCASCYYYNKPCPRGLGKIAPHLFRRDSGAPAIGNKLARIFWPYWYFGLPALGFAALLLFHFRWLTVFFAAAFAVTGAVSAVVNRQWCCRECHNSVTCARSPYARRT